MAEGATLPVIRAGGFEVRVNAYAVGLTRRAADRLPLVSAPAEPLAPLAPTMPSAASSTLDARGGVNARVRAGERPYPSEGCAGGATDLWYLSLVGARGQGTTLRAIWANLVSNREHSVWLEGVGSVALGHHRLDLANLGYPIHWTYRQALVPPGRDVHAVLESDALTCYDPLLAPDTSRKRSVRSAAPDSQTGGRRRGQTEGGAGTVTLSSSGTTSDVEDAALAREMRPLFVLLVHADYGGMDPSAPAQARVREHAADLARLHLRFLSTRIAWLPYYPRWADYLWHRALERGEAEPLLLWCYDPSPGAVEYEGHDRGRDNGTVPHREGSATRGGGASGVPRSLPGYRPLLTGAYLCRPDPLALTADLQRAIREGVFHTSPAAERTDGTEGPAEQLAA